MQGDRTPSTIVLLILGLMASGCASSPAPTTDNADRLGERAADVATTMVGAPYRYGGRSPRGFDCSGLVYYSYARAGMTVPRTTRAQRGSTRKVSNSQLSRGDLLFFNQEGKKSSHVAIYLGRDQFVHAPSSGKIVRVDLLSNPYWQEHFVDARRFY